MSCHSLPAWRVSIDRSAVILMGILCVLFVVSPLLLLIFVLCVWSLLIRLICVLGCFALAYPVWDSLGSLDLGSYFLRHFQEVFNFCLLKYFLKAFLFAFFFWNSYDSNVGVFHIFPEVSEVVLISFNSFFSFPRCYIYFHHSTFHLTYLLPQLFYCWFPPECFWSHLLHYWLFFISSRSLLNISCIFLIFVSRLSVTPFCFQDFGSSVLSLFWILF